ncbi:hypothetical protein [Actinoplanes sp. NPDC051859]|uniref:hypothetical protein n=1 Tax=Actinoplanes sp. NPDC051859 TaxID=3363909 RepID=UPI00379DB0C3
MVDDLSRELSSVSAALLRGLIRNPATPVEVLLRLLDADVPDMSAALKRRRDLPLPVQRAMVRHTAGDVRRALAGHPRLHTEVLQLVIADNDCRLLLQVIDRFMEAPLTDDELELVLSRAADGRYDYLLDEKDVLEELSFSTLCRRWLSVAARHSHPRVRLWAAQWAAFLDEPSRLVLRADPVLKVRATLVARMAAHMRVMRPADLPPMICHATWAILQQPLSRALVGQVVAGGNHDMMYYVAANPSTPADVVRTLLRHDSREIRQQVAGRADLDREQLLRLSADPAVEVRTAVSVHPGLSEEQRAAIDIDVTVGLHETCSRPWCRAFLLGPLGRVASREDSLRWARSVNPLLRRRAAHYAELPADLVASLAQDSDLGVRTLLAQHHPDAPPDLLLQCYLEQDGRGRERLVARPQFPTEGLARFAEHRDPAVRRLVALDPDVAGEIIEALCADPDASVRAAMAECPRLPVTRLIELLDDPESAEHAAANSALPADERERLLRLVS